MQVNRKVSSWRGSCADELARSGLVQYLITIAASDTELGSNILWHTITLLSKWDESVGGKVEVVANYGFYPIPGGYDDDTFYGNLKRKANVKIDTQGNHGWLKREKYHELDRGYGLHGVTYEVDEETFIQFQKNYEQELIEQAEAVKEIVKVNHLKPSQSSYRYYPEEELRKNIFAIELAKSRSEGLPPRLKRFDLDLTWGLTGPSLAKSNSCKTHAVTHLKKAVGEPKTRRLTAGGHDAVPRWSGPVEKICLHSTGPLISFQVKDKIVYSRDGSNPEVKLYWTVPPQELVTDSAETRRQFMLDVKYEAQIKPLVRKLQTLQQFFIDAPLTPELSEFKQKIILQLQSFYEFFSLVPKHNGYNYPRGNASLGDYLVNTLFAPARNSPEGELQKAIRKATLFLEMLYTAIADGWSEDEEEQVEENQIEVAVIEGAHHNTVGNFVEIDGTELLMKVAHLSVQNKQKICAILGRSYLEPDFEMDGAPAFF